MRTSLVMVMLLGCGGAPSTGASTLPAPRTAASHSPSSPPPEAPARSPVCPEANGAADAVTDAHTVENELAVAALERGLSSQDRTVVEAALAELRAQGAGHPRHALTAYAEGRLRSRLGDRAGAMLAYERAVAAHPSFGAAFYSMAVVLSNLGQRERAIDMFQRAVSLDPGNVDAWYNLAQSHYLQEQFEEALFGWTCALALAPADFGIQKKLVQAHHALGHFEEALVLRRALRERWRAGQAPSGTRNMVIDQFHVGPEHIYVQETLTEDPELQYVYVFVCTVDDQTIRTVQLESSAVIRSLGTDSLMGMDVGSIHSTFGIGFRERPTYEALRPIAIELIERIQAGNAQPGTSSRRGGG